jgi:hypothetical protein
MRCQVSGFRCQGGAEVGRGKDRGALRLRSTSFEERPGGLEKEVARGKLLKSEVGRLIEFGSGINKKVGRWEGEWVRGIRKSDPSPSNRAGLCRG